ncbi:MAG: hypothetical protein EXR73_06705 [Myxococcales bacterium]|nr:hypothetical protein [Myxococcales bacterium]
MPRAATRLHGAVVSLAAVALVLWPLTRDPRLPTSDDFPLSTYPMFAWPRTARLVLLYARGATADGARRALPPTVVASSEPLQAYVVLRAAVRAGDQPTHELCARIAARVAARADLADVATVLIVRGEHDALDALLLGKFGDEQLHARCDVPRAGGTP